MPNIDFTQNFVNSVKIPEQGQIQYYGTGKDKGLTLILRSNGSKVWYFKYELNGNRILRKITDAADANVFKLPLLRKKLELYREKIAQGFDPFEEIKSYKECPLVQDLVEYYLENYSRVYKADKTYKSDVSRSKKYILPMIGHYKLTELDSEIMENIIMQIGHPKMQKDEGTERPGQANKVRVLVSNMYNQALSWKEFKPYVKNNPVDKSITKFDDKAKTRYMSDLELKYFIPTLWEFATTMNPFQRAAQSICFMVFTGARKEHCLSVKWDDIDFNTETWFNTIHNKTKRKNPTPLNSNAMTVLRFIRSNMIQPTDNPYIFPSPLLEGDYIKSPRKAMIAIQKEAEKRGKIYGEPINVSDVTFHDLRRTFASHMLLKGGDIYTVSKSLGHSSVSTTEKHYAFLAQNEIRKASDKMSESMPKISLVKAI